MCVVSRSAPSTVSVRRLVGVIVLIGASYSIPMRLFASDALEDYVQASDPFLLMAPAALFAAIQLVAFHLLYRRQTHTPWLARLVVLFALNAMTAAAVLDELPEPGWPMGLFAEADGGGLVAVVMLAVLHIGSPLVLLGQGRLLRLYHCGSCGRDRRIWRRVPRLCHGLSNRPDGCRDRAMLCPTCDTGPTAACRRCIKPVACRTCHADLREGGRCPGLPDRPCPGKQLLCPTHDGSRCAHCEEVAELLATERPVNERPAATCNLCGSPANEEMGPLHICFNSKGCRKTAHRECFEYEGYLCYNTDCYLGREPYVLPGRGAVRITGPHTGSHQAVGADAPARATHPDPGLMAPQTGSRPTGRRPPRRVAPSGPNKTPGGMRVVGRSAER